MYNVIGKTNFFSKSCRVRVAQRRSFHCSDSNVFDLNFFPRLPTRSVEKRKKEKEGGKKIKKFRFAVYHRASRSSCRGYHGYRALCVRLAEVRAKRRCQKSAAVPLRPPPDAGVWSRIFFFFPRRAHSVFLIFFFIVFIILSVSGVFFFFFSSFR